ncbi:hypothetical protein V500_05149 [Pseudogymnoascus sp. VKM F-4518 (FW-2643)]|nr:hypothetical protein V500_05149 [Pseudogymnoascus sp. VKM F-4518 (FW-2643)]
MLIEVSEPSHPCQAITHSRPELALKGSHFMARAFQEVTTPASSPKLFIRFYRRRAIERNVFSYSSQCPGYGETFGYYGRTKAHQNVSEVGSWMLQNVLILGGPTFLAATVYMTLGRYITALDAHDHAMIAPRWITRIYVLIDVFCFVSQFMGAGIQASGDPKVIDIGNKAILAGLIFQLVAIAFFVLMAIRVHSRLNRQHEVYTPAPSRWPISRKYFWSLYVVSVLFIVRNLVRAIEYAQQASSGGISYATRNTDGTVTMPEKEGPSSIGSNEIFLYIFDAAPMALVALIFLLLHPGRMLKAARWGKGERLLEMENGITMSGKSQRMRQGQQPPAEEEEEELQ